VRLATAIALFLVPASSALAVPLPPIRTPYDLRGAAIYSNLCVERETGDINGLRVFVRPIGSQPRVLAQYAEGGLLAPEAAASILIAGGQLQLEIVSDVPEASFSGVLRKDRLLVRSHQFGAKTF
jgi:hypothetical protein